MELTKFLFHSSTIAMLRLLCPGPTLCFASLKRDAEHRSCFVAGGFSKCASPWPREFYSFVDIEIILVFKQHNPAVSEYQS